MLHGAFAFSPRNVSRLPKDVTVGKFDGTLALTPRHHSCFAHSFVEETFSLWWTMAQFYGTWNIDPKAMTRFVIGPTTDKIKAMAQSIDRKTGRTKDYFRNIQRLYFNEVSFFAGHMGLGKFGVTRFPGVLAGGTEGRTVSSLLFLLVNIAVDTGFLREFLAFLFLLFNVLLHANDKRSGLAKCVCLCVCY